MFAKEVTSNENQGPKDSSAQTSSSSSPTGEVTPSTNTSQVSLPSVPLSATAPSDTEQAAPPAASPEQTEASIADKTLDAHIVNAECNQKIQAAFDSLQAGADALAKRLQDESPESKDSVATALGALAESVKTLIAKGQQSEEKLSKQIEDGLENLRNSFEEQVSALTAGATGDSKNRDAIAASVERALSEKISAVEVAVKNRCFEVMGRIGALEETLRSAAASTSMEQPVSNIQIPKTSTTATWFGAVASVFAGSAISIGSMLLGLEMGFEFAEGLKPEQPVPTKPVSPVPTNKTLKVPELPKARAGVADEAKMPTVEKTVPKRIGDAGNTEGAPAPQVSPRIQNLERRAAELELDTQPERALRQKADADAQKAKPRDTGNQQAK